MSKKKPEPDYDPLKVISKKLSKRGTRPRNKTIETLLQRLETGEYRMKSGVYKLSGAQTLEMVVKLIAMEVGPREISWKVSRRFDWSSVTKEMIDYSRSQGVDPDLVKQALLDRQSPKTARRKSEGRNKG